MTSLEELRAAVRAEYVCEYCGKAGELYRELEIRRILRRGSIYVCKDVEACDVRWTAQNPEDES